MDWDVEYEFHTHSGVWQMVSENTLLYRIVIVGKALVYCCMMIPTFVHLQISAELQVYLFL